MPRPKKQVMMERPEELLRSYYEMCTCRGDQYGSPGACDICKAQPEALAQLKKTRKSLVLMETWQPPTKALKEDGKLSTDEFDETMRALEVAIQYVQTNGTQKQKDELNEAWINMAKAGVIGASTGIVETYTNTPGAPCASSVAFPKEGTELHATLKKKGLFDMLCDDLKSTVRKAKKLYKHDPAPTGEDKALPEDWE